MSLFSHIETVLRQGTVAKNFYLCNIKSSMKHAKVIGFLVAGIMIAAGTAVQGIVYAFLLGASFFALALTLLGFDLRQLPGAGAQEYNSREYTPEKMLKWR